MMKAAVIFAALLVSFSIGTESRVLLQTGANSTSDSSPVVIRWVEPENGVLDAVRIPINGTVQFTWTGQHDLWEVPSAQCPSTFTNGSGITQLAPRSTGGTRVVGNFTREVVRYFACSVADHCANGQLIAVRVGNARAAAPGPSAASAPRSSSSYGGNSSPGYAGGSSSNYGSSNSGSGSNSSSTTTSSSTSSSSYGGNSSPGYGGGSSSNYGASNSGK